MLYMRKSRALPCLTGAGRQVKPSGSPVVHLEEKDVCYQAS